MQENTVDQKPAGVTICPEVPVQIGDFKIELTINGVLVIQTNEDLQAIHKMSSGKIAFVPKHN